MEQLQQNNQLIINIEKIFVTLITKLQESKITVSDELINFINKKILNQLFFSEDGTYNHRKRREHFKCLRKAILSAVDELYMQLDEEPNNSSPRLLPLHVLIPTLYQYTRDLHNEWGDITPLDHINKRIHWSCYSIIAFSAQLYISSREKEPLNAATHAFIELCHRLEITRLNKRIDKFLEFEKINPEVLYLLDEFCDKLYCMAKTYLSFAMFNTDNDDYKKLLEQAKSYCQKLLMYKTYLLNNENDPEGNLPTTEEIKLIIEKIDKEIGTKHDQPSPKPVFKSTNKDNNPKMTKKRKNPDENILENKDKFYPQASSPKKIMTKEPQSTLNVSMTKNTLFQIKSNFIKTIKPILMRDPQSSPNRLKKKVIFSENHTEQQIVPSKKHPLTQRLNNYYEDKLCLSSNYDDFNAVDNILSGICDSEDEAKSLLEYYPNLIISATLEAVINGSASQIQSVVFKAIVDYADANNINNITSLFNPSHLFNKDTKKLFLKIAAEKEAPGQQKTSSYKSSSISENNNNSSFSLECDESLDDIVQFGF